MKDQFYLAVIVISLFLCGCSSTKYTVYHGTETFQGKGGVIEAVDNIDFYEDGGEPYRKYRILGFIEEKPHHRVPLGHFSKVFSGSNDHNDAIAKLAVKHGGDAVIVVNATPAASDEDDSGSQRHHRQPKKYVVVKYVQ